MKREFKQNLKEELKFLKTAVQTKIFHLERIKNPKWKIKMNRYIEIIKYIDSINLDEVYKLVIAKFSNKLTSVFTVFINVPIAYEFNYPVSYRIRIYKDLSVKIDSAQIASNKKDLTLGGI